MGLNFGFTFTLFSFLPVSSLVLVYWFVLLFSFMLCLCGAGLVGFLTCLVCLVVGAF